MTVRLVTSVCAMAAALVVAALGHGRHWTGASQPAPRPPVAGPVAPTQLGMTLGSPSYWSAEWPFDDPIRSTAAVWFMTPAGQWQPLTNQVKTDAGGHPVDVPAGAKLIVFVQQGAPHQRTGKFDCTISPGWAIRPFGDWQMSGTGPAFQMTVTQPASKASVVLLLTATRANTALTELSCRPADAPARLFNPAFLAELRPFHVLRFMDWLRINNAPPRRWSDRPTPATFSQAGPGGVAIEHIVALANAAHADPWINLPLDADADYYRETALYVRDHLSPDRRVYVELSNEVWNLGFAQAKAATERGLQQYPGVPATQANDFYYADRVRAAMAVWSTVFAGQRQRLVRVLASQAVNPRRAEEALAHLDTWRSVDALATAPYFGAEAVNVVAPAGPARVDAIFAQGPQMVDHAIGYALAAKAVARAHGLRYISYEGGPAFSSYRPDLRADMLAVNNDPRMRDLYALYLRRWKAEVGDLLVLFDLVSTPSVGGSWGHRVYTGQPIEEAPKARAVEEFGRSQMAD